MSIPIAIVIAVAVAFAAIVVVRQVCAWWKFRGQRIVTCPETRQPAGVELDARHAAATSFTGSPELRLTSCTRWPERAGCGAPCLGEIAAAPADCLVRNIVAKWYEGKSCAACGQRFEVIDFTAAKPALLLPDGSSIEWSQVPPDALHHKMEQARPLCFGCHMASTMVRQRPELVSDRSGKDVAARKT